MPAIPPARVCLMVIMAFSYDAPSTTLTKISPIGGILLDARKDFIKMNVFYDHIIHTDVSSLAYAKPAMLSTSIVTIHARTQIQWQCTTMVKFRLPESCSRH
jgi:hypothetical protein